MFSVNPYSTLAETISPLAIQGFILDKIIDQPLYQSQSII